jgi:hypothetical protein
MVKGAAISMRVEPSLKAQLEAAASEAGMTLAAFAERALEVHARTPVWSLDKASGSGRLAGCLIDPRAR